MAQITEIANGNTIPVETNPSSTPIIDNKDGPNRPATAADTRYAACTS